MFDDDPTLVEGEMTVTSKGKVKRGTPGQPDFNTLDEPIKETIVSDDPEDELAKLYFRLSRCSFVTCWRSAVSSNMSYTRKRRIVC